MAAFSPPSCTRGSQRTNAHRAFEDIKVGCALRPSRRLSSVAARRASPLDSALRVDLETTLGHRQLHPDASHMRRVSPPRVSLYSMLGCELKKARSAPAASSSTHAVLVPLGWPEDDSAGTTQHAKSERHHRGRINGAAAARDTNSELLPLARPPPPRGRPESGLAHRRPPQHADPRCTLRPPGRGAHSNFGPLASP